jgi:hypothetical protein
MIVGLQTHESKSRQVFANMQSGKPGFSGHIASLQSVPLTSVGAFVHMQSVALSSGQVLAGVQGGKRRLRRMFVRVQGDA